MKNYDYAHVIEKNISATTDTLTIPSDGVIHYVLRNGGNNTDGQKKAKLYIDDNPVAGTTLYRGNTEPFNVEGDLPVVTGQTVKAECQSGGSWPAQAYIVFYPYAN